MHILSIVMAVVVKYDAVAKEIELGEINGSAHSTSVSSIVSLASPKISWHNLNIVSTSVVSKVAEELLHIDSSKFTNGAPKEKHHIVRNVSGQLTGGLNGILGPSGSGKTTFLNALARRLDPLRMSASGDIRINDQQYTYNDLKSFSGYVMQVL